MTRTRRRRPRFTPLVGAAVVSLMAANTAGTAVAAPSTPGTPALDRIADRLLGNQTRTHDITLITGDTVHVRVAANGGYTTKVDIAPRADGRQVLTQTLVGGEHAYVIPSDAAPLIASGQVDRRLFDVRQLIEDGYADADSASLPVIVQYAGQPARTTVTPQVRAQNEARVAAKADALPASRSVRALGSINAAAVSVTKKDAVDLWSTVAPNATPKATPKATPNTGPSTLGAGLSKVWLDGRVRASLDVSVPMVGAPEAWAAGYDGKGVKVAVLDTGVDTTHPDLAGRVAVSKSFIPGVDSVQDGHGHGTHVASTVAGTGAAAGGKYKGVAPGADLAIGKVLNDGGSGAESWIIDGMEWAATTAGARIVSMSLGTGTPSDGTDPMSQAVNDLTASTGALFVIAAGNEGPAASTVAAPGAADGALTVAAVDKQDQLAGFSNRGPRARDYALKPEIAAPGVNITAARAAGTTMGPIVDERYTTISGTSMATPHVAGAAAILAQQHPDWTGEQIKAALTSTSKDDGYTVYEQGAGRLDVAAASRATVLADTVKVDFGRLRFPHDGPAISKTVSYRNTGTTPVTLDLAASLRAEDGSDAPAGMLTVSPSTLEVPAGGTAAATVTLDPTLGPISPYSGAITATAEGVSLHVPVGVYKEPEGFNLTINTVVPDDAVDGILSAHILKRVDKDTGQWIFLGGGMSTTTHLDNGVYAVYRTAGWSATEGDFLDMTLLVNPEVRLTKDTTITLDANTADRVDVETRDRPTEPFGTTLGAWRIPAGSEIPYGVVTGQAPYRAHYWVTPTERATVGRFLLEHQHMLGTPPITASVPKQGRAPALTLHPRYQSFDVYGPKLDGQLDLPVVNVGSGSAEELAKVNVRGKVALLSLGDRSMAPILGTEYPGAEINAMKQAGAKAVFAYTDAGWPVMGGFGMPPGIYVLPTVALSAEEGKALHDRAARGSTTLRINSQPSVPDVYVLSYMEEGQVPASLHRTVSDSELATLRTNYHGDRPIDTVQTWGVRRPDVFRPDEFSASFMSTSLDHTAGPVRRTEHIGPVGAGMPWSRGYNTFDLARILELGMPQAFEAYLGSTFTNDMFTRPIVRSEDWNQAPAVPGVFVFQDGVSELLGEAGGVCSFCRYSGLLPDGDLLPVWPVTVDGANHYGQLTAFSFGGGVDELHLYRDGVELPQQNLGGEVPLPAYILPSGKATYRLTHHFEDALVQAGYGTKADTTWTFTSNDPTGRDIPAGYDTIGLCVDKCRVEPMLFLRYGYNLGPDNRLAAPGTHTFTVTAYRQATDGAAMPRVAGMKVSASFDGGKTWTRVTTRAAGDGKFTVTLPHPKLRTATGTVSLRTEAWDTAGSRIEQTIPDAYGLVSRH